MYIKYDFVFAALLWLCSTKSNVNIFRIGLSNNDNGPLQKYLWAVTQLNDF